MKKETREYFFLIGVLLLAYWWFNHEPPVTNPKSVVSEKPPSPNTETVKQAEAVLPREQSQGGRIRKQQLISSQKENRTLTLPQPKRPQVVKKSTDTIPFKNYKGMAIAYGDVLLGKLQDPVASGFTKIPEIGYWGSATIPYFIQPNAPHPDRILKALSYISENTVLQFVPLEEGMPDAIVFEPTEENCFSYVGKVGGTQPIFISPGCEWFHIVHEVLHAVGLVHEHSRPDRDQFISIRWENIPESYQSQFEVLPDELVKDWMHYDYDSSSIMHYGSQVFIAKSKGTSLNRKDGSQIPEPHALSPGDIRKVNDLFQGR